MGYWGQRFYGELTMRDVRSMIEADTSMTVKVLKFGYAVCVVDDLAIEKHKHWKDMVQRGINPRNFICIALWRKSSNYLMIKQVTEDMGPVEVDIPLKYVNSECELSVNSEYAINWRNRVREYHAKRKEALKFANSLKFGDTFFVYGEQYSFSYKKNSKWFIGKNLENNRTYRLRPMQICRDKVKLPDGVVLRN